MNKVQVRLIDPSHGKIITKTFEGDYAVTEALLYLSKFEPQQKAQR